MYKYEMDPTRTIGVTERTRDAGRTDGQTDGRSETNIPPTPQQLRCVWGIIMMTTIFIKMINGDDMMMMMITVVMMMMI